MIPGETPLAPGDVTVNADREAPGLAVANAGARPVQFGSGHHFAETTPAREVRLIPCAGARRMFGFRAEVS